MSFEYENDYENDDLDLEMEPFIEYIRMIKEEDERAGIVRIPNPKKLKEMEQSVTTLESIAKRFDINAKVEYGIEGFAHVGFVRLRFPTGLIVSEMAEFCQAVKDVSNLEFTIENDMAQIGILYYDVMESRRLS